MSKEELKRGNAIGDDDTHYATINAASGQSQTHHSVVFRVGASQDGERDRVMDHAGLSSATFLFYPASTKMTASTISLMCQGSVSASFRTLQEKKKIRCRYLLTNTL